MKKVLKESQMQILYEEKSCYMIEKSPIIACLNGVKIVEFVQSEGKKRIKMVEAKASAPIPTNADDYNEYISEICEKFQNSISVINAARLKRRENIFNELPGPLQSVDYKMTLYWLYLIIKKSKEDWVVNLSADLRRQLHPFLKCWNIPDANFEVLTEDMARKKGLVL